MKTNKIQLLKSNEKNKSLLVNEKTGLYQIIVSALDVGIAPGSDSYSLKQAIENYLKPILKSSVQVSSWADFEDVESRELLYDVNYKK